MTGAAGTDDAWLAASTSSPPAAHAGERAVLRGRGRAARALLPRDGRALRARRAADRRRPLPGRPLGRPPRRRRVRPPRDRRQARAARDRARRRGRRRRPPSSIGARRGRRHRDRLHRPTQRTSRRLGRRWPSRASGAARRSPSPRAGAEWEFEVGDDDPFVDQEVAETLYHVLWELVHVFFDHRGLLEGREARPVHDTGGSSFLYPFLSESEHDLDAVTDDVRSSVLMKSEEVGALREATLAREPRHPDRGRGRAARALRRGRAPARLRQRGLRDGRDGRSRRLPPAAARLAAARARSISPRTPRS